jgi:hypothetical protein
MAKTEGLGLAVSILPEAWQSRREGFKIGKSVGIGVSERRLARECEQHSEIPSRDAS